MKRLPLPSEDRIREIVENERQATVKDLADISGFEYGPCRRVAEGLAKKGILRKVMKGTRRFHFEPALPTLGLGDRREDYPPEWINAAVDPDTVPLTEDEESGRDSIVLTGDLETFEIRCGGRKLGEISEIDLKLRARYQITSPWGPETWSRISLAIKALKKRLDRPSDL